jgi:hypothetical protein
MCRGPGPIANMGHRVVGDCEPDSRSNGGKVELQEPGAVSEVRAVGDGDRFFRMHHDVGEPRATARGHALSETVPVVEQFDAVAVGRHDRLQVASLRVDRRNGDDVGEQRAGGVELVSVESQHAFCVREHRGVGARGSLSVGVGDRVAEHHP